MSVVTHGGGEPTLARAWLDRALDICDEAARCRHLAPFYYLATHGVLDAETASWTASRFHQIGLSCDGPPDIHDQQRRSARGPTSMAVIETARRLNALKVSVAVRATITRRSAPRMVEIVEWLGQHFNPVEIRLEPLYRRGRALENALDQSPDPDVFVAQFLAAQARGRSLGIAVEYSGVRLEELHGPYCHTARQVLAITPDDLVTACFDATERSAAKTERLFIGAEGKLDAERVRAHREASSICPARCDDCFNRFHCARQCPSWCGARDDPREDPPGPLCRIAQGLALGWLRERAGLPAQGG